MKMEKMPICCAGICFACCVFMLLGCFYITITAQELRDMQSQCKCAKSETGVNKNNGHNQEVLEWSNGFRIQTHVNALQYRTKRMVPNFMEELKTRHKRRTKDKKKKRSKTKAGHYITFAHTDAYVNENVEGYDDSTEGSIHVFKPSPWVSKKLEPFSLKSNGEFHAKHNGIYFIYAQVLFHDNKYMQAITMQHNQAKTGTKSAVLSCYSSGGNPDQREVYNTCSMQGLVALKKKDILTIENEMHDVKLHMRKATTYFGAFVLR